MHRKRMIVPIFIPHQGCPYRCLFCNQNEISGADQQKDLSRLDRAFDTYFNSGKLDCLPPQREVAFYGGTFTALPVERQKLFLSSVQNWVERGYVQSIRLSTHPGAIHPEVLDLLSNYSVKTIELGVQSTQPAVLRASGREDTLESLKLAVHLIKAGGYRLGLQLMPGLPEDSEKTFYQTVSDSLVFKPDYVRIYPSLVIQGTALHEMYVKGEYFPWSLERTVKALTSAVRRFEEAGVTVIRLGLHPEPSLLKSIVDGPFHPALRTLVESRICYEEMVRLLKGRGILPDKVIFKVPLHKISIYTGYAKENINKLKTKFSIKELKFLENSNLKAAELLI